MSIPAGGASPQSSGASAPNQGAGAKPSAASQGGDSQSFDFKQAYEATQSELGQAKKGMQKLWSDFGDLKKGKEASDQTLGKLKEVFAPEPKEVDPYDTSADEAELDFIIQKAYEADKAGSPIPMTAKAYMTAVQNGIELKKMNKALLARLDKLEGATRAAHDPQVAIDRTSYSNMDGFVQQGLDQIYGNDASYDPVKSHQFDAITGALSQQLKQIQKANPQAWDRIRRDPQLQRQLVQAQIKQTLPPKAVQVMEQEHLRNTPMSTDELWQAFREAKGITDDGQRQQLRAQIRQDILKRMTGSKKGR